MITPLTPAELLSIQIYSQWFVPRKRAALIRTSNRIARKRGKRNAA